MKPINVDFTEVDVNGVEITNRSKHAEVILKDEVILKAVSLHVKPKSLREISTQQIKLKSLRTIFA